MLKDRCIIYEGVFDPPHIGHFWTLQRAKERFDADAIVVPATNKAAKELSHKPKVTTYGTRLVWCKVGFSNIAAVYATRKIYTVDVVRSITTAFKSYYSEWIYLIGPDHSILNYKNNDEISKMVHVLPAIEKLSVRSTEIRERIRDGLTVEGLLAPGLDIEDVEPKFTRQ